MTSRVFLGRHPAPPSPRRALGCAYPCVGVVVRRPKGRAFGPSDRNVLEKWSQSHPGQWPGNSGQCQGRNLNPGQLQATPGNSRHLQATPGASRQRYATRRAAAPPLLATGGALRACRKGAPPSGWVLGYLGWVLEYPARGTRVPSPRYPSTQPEVPEYLASGFSCTRLCVLGRSRLCARDLV